MNILIPDSWLKVFLKTQADPQEIAKDLSLCSQSVEEIRKTDTDSVYNIEITSNRPDCFSIYGIARELGAVLPRFGVKAKFESLDADLNLPEIKNGLPLTVKIAQPSLCPRFTALIFDNVTIKPSPKIVQERLVKSGIRALNNVIDISNYLMLELGQPMHTFDYDKILGAKMILRLSKKGEKVTTIDHTERTLPEGVIVMEDGESRLIDLCGIMGGANSEIDEKTKRVLLFIQTYDPITIRRACQLLGFRTEAASRFEKGVDPEGVMLAMKQAIKMLEELAGAKIASKLIDIYPHPQKTKTVILSQEKLDSVLGVHIDLPKAKKNLEDLGFTTTIKGKTLEAVVPHWRNEDVSIPEDLIEEVARIYGYHNLPTSFPPLKPALNPLHTTFYWENEAKGVLNDWGFTETISYSMVSKDLLEITGYSPEKYLKIANPLTADMVYMRPSLIPSLLEIIKQNENQEKTIEIFELANVYLPQGPTTLPHERSTLSAVISGDKFYEIKGVIELLLKNLGITETEFKPYVGKNILYHPARTAVIETKKELLGLVGEINPQVLSKLGIRERIVFFELDFETLSKIAKVTKTYQTIPVYPPIIEDLSFVVLPKTLVGEMIQSIKSVNSLIQNVELLSSYESTRTFRITYQNPQKTMNDEEVKKLRKEVVKKIEEKFGAKLKG